MPGYLYRATLETFADGKGPETLPTDSKGRPLVATVAAEGALGTQPATGTQTSIADVAADATILAANTARKGATIYNDSSSLLYLLVGAGTSSTTVFTVKMAPDDFYELPMMLGGVYTGIIKGIWSADSTGSARVTEFT
jgi:hypothetical protein